MVKLLRVDERLLHGQIAVSWLSHVPVTSILIANDEVMQDEMTKVAIKLAKPADVKLAIRDIEGAAALIKDPRSENIPIFVIVRTIKDALRLVEASENMISHINIGGLRRKDGGKMVGAICLTEEDIVGLKQLNSMVDDLELRIVPTDAKMTMKDIE